MRKLAIFSLAVVMTGCSSLDTRKFTELSTEPAGSRLATIIYTHEGEKCPSDLGEDAINLEIAEKGGDKSVVPVLIAAPLIAAGVSLAATFIVNSVNAAIDEYKQGLSGSFGAAGVTKKAIPVGDSCVIIARGLMGSMERPINAVKGEFLEKDFLVKYSYVLGFQSYPAFYLELRATTVESIPGDKTKAETPGTIVLIPNHLSYAESAAKNRGSWRKHVGLALAFSNTAQKKSDEIKEETAFANFHYDLGRLEIGKRYNKALLGGTGASASLTAEQFPKGAFNITAVVSDSEDPGIIFNILNSTFTSKKADLETALRETITNAINKSKPPSTPK